MREGSSLVDVVVVGAGVSGLTAARELERVGAEVVVIDSAQRAGGRALSVAADEDARQRFDLGASWLWPAQLELLALLEELELAVYRQYEDGDALYDHAPHLPARSLGPTAMGALRIIGGAQALATALVASLAREPLLATTVRHIDLCGSGVTTHLQHCSEASRVESRAVVLAVPPKAVSALQISPNLPTDLLVRSAQVPTWMAGTYKVIIGYRDAFWRSAGRSGLVLSHVGPLREIHDATLPSGRAALMGMAIDHGPTLGAATASERRTAILEQVARAHGPDALEPTSLVDHHWPSDAPSEEATPYGDPFLRRPYGAGRVWLAGAETSILSGGQLHGAVLAGRRAAAGVLARHGRQRPDRRAWRSGEQRATTPLDQERA